MSSISKLVVGTILFLCIGNSVTFSQDTTYIVQSGDNLSSIAKKFGTNKDSLIKWNNLGNPDRLSDGEAIRILSINYSDTVDGLKSTNVGNEVGGLQKKQKVNNLDRDDSDKSKDSQFNLFLFIVALLLVGLAIIWRVKYWSRLKVRNKNRLFFLAIGLGILLTLLSWGNVRELLWDIIRILLLVSICFVAIIAIVYYVRKKNKNDNGQTSHNNLPTGDINSQRQIGQLQLQNDQLKNTIRGLENTIKKLNREKDDLLEENVKLGEEIDRLKESVHPNGETGIEVMTKKQLGNDEEEHDTIKKPNGKLYAESILDGVLVRVKEKVSEDSIFELDFNGNEESSLTILPNAYKRVLANSAFIDGCEKQITGNTTVNVIPGKAIHNDQDKWLVTVKPVVIIN